MSGLEKGYLMTAGVLAPAFLAVGIASLITKKPISLKSTTLIVTFAVVSIAGGFVSAQIIKKAE